MPQLRVLAGAAEGQEFALGGTNLIIGRDPACDIQLEPTSGASRQHATVYSANGEWRIQDLGSLNGTFLNDQKIDDQPLSAGDKITVAHWTFVFEENGVARTESTPARVAEPAPVIAREPESVVAPPQPELARVAAPAAAAPVAPAPVPAPAPAPGARAAEPEPMTEDDARVQQIVREMSRKTLMIENEIGKAIIGQKEIVRELLTAIISGGHVLMIGLPGLAKTTLISTLSQVLHLKFRRIQFTPDLMPSDITGTDILEIDEATGKKDYRFIRGPIFTNILLADEINRTPPKTQAALLEAMQEHRVTAAGETYVLDPPFFVLATQNPLEQEGTYPLPEAQLDRFMFSVYIDYPDEESEEIIAKVTTRKSKFVLEKVLDGPEIIELQRVVREMPISDHVIKYATRIVRSTRPGDRRAPDFVKKWVHCGAGPRASQYMVIAAKARAVIDGRLLVTTDDVRAAARPILRHRMFTNFTADSEGVDTDKIVQRLLAEVQEPGEKDY